MSEVPDRGETAGNYELIYQIPMYLTIIFFLLYCIKWYLSSGAERIGQVFQPFMFFGVESVGFLLSSLFLLLILPSLYWLLYNSFTVWFADHGYAENSSIVKFSAYFIFCVIGLMTIIFTLGNNGDIFFKVIMVTFGLSIFLIPFLSKSLDHNSPHVAINKEISPSAQKTGVTEKANGIDQIRQRLSEKQTEFYKVNNILAPLFLAIIGWMLLLHYIGSFILIAALYWAYVRIQSRPKLRAEISDLEIQLKEYERKQIS
jgi:hypothetical protein